MTKPQLRHAAEPPFQQLTCTSSLLGADVQITQNYSQQAPLDKLHPSKSTCYSMQIFEDPSLGNTAPHRIVVSKYRTHLLPQLAASRCQFLIAG